MDYTSEFCAQIAKVHANIAIVAWLHKGKSVSWYVAPEIPIPNEDRQGTMGVQAELIRSMLKTNEDYFGKSHYIMMSMENADVYSFPVDDPGYLLTLVIMRPYEHDTVVQNVLEKLV